MWEKVQRIRVNRDHAIAIPKRLPLGGWFGAGPATLAPLFRKRRLLVDEAQLVGAWTLYNPSIPTEEWVEPPDANDRLHYPIVVTTKSPSGWIFTIPLELRRRNWLPEAGGTVVCECDKAEMNFWLEDVYNVEAIREAAE